MPQSHSAGKPGRVLLFDELRGLSILLVVIYHGAFDLIAVYGVRIPIFDAPLLQKFLQPLFAGLFVFISGAVSRYSRSNLRRGLACFACGLLITLVTGLLPMVPDRFGILHLLGASMVLFALLRPLLDRIPTAAGFLLFSPSSFSAGGCRTASSAFRPSPRSCPKAGTPPAPGSSPSGFPSPGLNPPTTSPSSPGPFSFRGSYLGVWARAGRLPSFCYRGRLPALQTVGRKSLWIYLLHQPVLVLLLGAFVWLARGVLGLPI